MKGKKLQQDEAMYAAMFGEDSICSDENDITIEEYDEVIAECESMLQYSISRNWTEEVAYWRKLLQKNKVCRRELMTAN